MKLLTKELLRKIPPLYSQENVPDPMVQCKFFTPDSSWTWYVTEGSAVLQGDEDGERHIALKDVRDWSDVLDVRFFGLVDGFEEELGYFLLSELQWVRGRLGLPIERDLYWRPQPLSKCRKR